jgi:hypothetical protein
LVSGGEESKAKGREAAEAAKPFFVEMRLKGYSTAQHGLVV